MIMEEVFDAFGDATSVDSAILQAAPMNRWAEAHPLVVEKLVATFGLDQAFGILTTAFIVWFEAYRFGLPSDLEDIIADGYKR